MCFINFLSSSVFVLTGGKYRIGGVKGVGNLSEGEACFSFEAENEEISIQLLPCNTNERKLICGIMY